MDGNTDVSRRGYFYNLKESPYEWVSPYGDSYKLPSRKRLEMMEKRAAEELERVDKFIKRHGLYDVMPGKVVDLVRHYVIEAVYRQIVE